jgi:DNA-binding transcriptional LysR family regulator
LKILEELAVIYREEGSGTRYIMEKFIENNNLNVPKKSRAYGNEAVKQAVMAGLGCSIMPLIGVKNELNNGVYKLFL